MILREKQMPVPMMTKYPRPSKTVDELTTLLESARKKSTNRKRTIRSIQTAYDLARLRSQVLTLELKDTTGRLSAWRFLATAMGPVGFLLCLAMRNF